jgi:mannose-6-phosphate isomerase-like protein (cupin superfamily)
MANQPTATPTTAASSTATPSTETGATATPTVGNAAVSEPVAISDVLDTFTDLWSPRIAGSVNDYDVRLAKVRGEHIWHTHDHTDEFFLVVEGELRIGLREPAGERTVTLSKGSLFTVPRGVEHKPSAPSGAVIMLIEPTGTLTVGDRHEEVPAHVDVTTGHPLA